MPYYSAEYSDSTRHIPNPFQCFECPNARLTNFVAWFSIWSSLIVITDEGRNPETESKSQFTFAISFDLIIFNELKANSRIIKLMYGTENIFTQIKMTMSIKM